MNGNFSRLTLAFVAAMLSAQVAGAVAPPAPYKITAIKALLFYDNKGTFSRDVLAKPAFTFWNTIIGEGDAGAPSNSTLVLVEVTGDTTSSESRTARVDFVATESGKPILKRAGEIGLLDRNGKVFVPFWLYNTGCRPIKITARIVGQSVASTMSKTIPFACGE